MKQKGQRIEIKSPLVMHVQQNLVEILSVFKEIRALKENLKLYQRGNYNNQIQKINRSKKQENHIKHKKIKERI